jgi:hypothetical protein
MKSKLKYRARNVLALIDRFNAVSKWTATLIVTPEKLRLRTKVIIKFVKICQVWKIIDLKRFFFLLLCC